jgi:hypothetical protein
MRWWTENYLFVFFFNFRRMLKVINLVSWLNFLFLFVFWSITRKLCRWLRSQNQVKQALLWLLFSSYKDFSLVYLQCWSGKKTNYLFNVWSTHTFDRRSSYISIGMRVKKSNFISNGKRKSYLSLFLWCLPKYENR